MAAPIDAARRRGARSGSTRRIAEEGEASTANDTASFATAPSAARHMSACATLSASQCTPADSASDTIDRNATATTSPNAISRVRTTPNAPCMRSPNTRSRPCCSSANVAVAPASVTAMPIIAFAPCSPRAGCAPLTRPADELRGLRRRRRRRSGRGARASRPPSPSSQPAIATTTSRNGASESTE